MAKNVFLGVNGRKKKLQQNSLKGVGCYVFETNVVKQWVNVEEYK